MAGEVNLYHIRAIQNLQGIIASVRRTIGTRWMAALFKGWQIGGHRNRSRCQQTSSSQTSRGKVWVPRRSVKRGHFAWRMWNWTDFPKLRSKPIRVEPLSSNLLSVQDYLERERVADSKSEFWDGVVYAMAGASFRHNRIVANLITTLGGQLRDQPCAVYASDLRVANQAGTRFFYPDVSVICGPPQILADEVDIATNPTVLIEVLSDTTAAFDRGRKFLAYQALSSLREYLLVSQDEPVIEHYLRQAHPSWLYTKYEGADSSLQLPSIQVVLALSDVYRNV